LNTAEKLERIAEILPEVINTKTSVRVRRGQVHAGICRLLRIPRSRANIKLIKAVLAATGIRSVTIRAKLFYVSYPDANPATAKVRAKAADKKL
jgi:hypothetical protein